MKSRLSELKSNKEYQAHLFEIEVANKKKGDIEEKILLCMEKIEQLQRTAKEAQEKLSVIEKAFAQGKQALDELERTLSTELADLEAQQQARSAHVEKGLLSRYNTIKAARKDQRTRRDQRGDLFRMPSSASSATDFRSQTLARSPHLSLLPSDALLGWTDSCRNHTRPRSREDVGA